LPTSLKLFHQLQSGILLNILEINFWLTQ